MTKGNDSISQGDRSEDMIVTDIITVCSQLDDAVERIFESYSEIKGLQKMIGVEMREGYLSLAQARNHMHRSNPVYTITSLQYPSTMHATLRVMITPNQDIDGAYTMEPHQAISDHQETNENEEPHKVPNNPIRWFGVLVPPALRIAQGHFKQAACIGITMASARSRLAGNVNQYEKLKKIKQALLLDPINDQ